MGPYRGPLGRVLAYAKVVPNRGAAVALARAFGRHMAPLVQGCNADAVVAVPPARARLWLRGFDTAALLAHSLADQLQLPVLHALARRQRAPQKALDARQRRVNARQSFRARGPAPARVLLVDDVITTGATLQSCGDELVGGGATTHVWGCALCADRRRPV